MLSKLLVAWLLMALCVALHVVGLTAAFRWVKRRTTRFDGRFSFAILNKVFGSGSGADPK